MITRVLLFIIFSFLYAIYKYYVFVAKFPKGPRPLPFIGNLAQYDFHAQNVSLHRIGRRQSSVYTLFTPLPVVHITQFALLKEAFIENGGSFVDRLENSTIQETYSFTPNGGVILANGDSWRDNRRAALHILRDSGMGKQGMAELVRESVADYIAHLDHLADSKIVSFRWPIQIMVANIINEVLFGFRYKFDECEPLMKYVNGFTKAMEDTVKSKSLLLCIVFPSLRNLPLIGTTKIRKQFAQIVFIFFKLCICLLLVNLLIAMMTRTYENISRTTHEYKRQWAKVILMLEVSMKPQDRLHNMFGYTVPTGTNKAIRSFPVTKKIDVKNMTEHEKEKQTNAEREVKEQRQMLYKKKKAELELRLRPATRAVAAATGGRRMTIFQS